MSTLLIASGVAVAALLVVVLPALVMAGWLFMVRRERVSPPVNLCRGYDIADPASKPCWVYAPGRYCARHDVDIVIST